MGITVFFFNSNGYYQQEELALQIALLIVDSTNQGSLSLFLSLSLSRSLSLSLAVALCSVIKARLENCERESSAAEIADVHGYIQRTSTGVSTGPLLAVVIC